MLSINISPQISQVRGVLLLVDAAVYAFWGFFWFVSFCFMADQWRRVNSDQRDGIEERLGRSTINNIQAAIAFTFFGILIWVRKPEKMILTK